MKKISIVGQITDTPYDGHFAPIDLKEQLEGVDDNEPLEVEITSEGGSVFSGLQIANILSRHNGKVTTHAVGLCASIATVILMSGDDIVVDDNCFCLIHLPWSYCEGNANDMMKEIDTLKKCETAMMGYYRKHAKVGDDVLSKLLNEETWFLGSEFADVFNVQVLECDRQMNIAARFDLNKFNKVDKRISIMNEDDKKKEKRTTTEEEVVEVTPQEPATDGEGGDAGDTPTPSGEVEQPEVEEPEVEEQPTEEDEQTPEQMKEEIASLKAKIAELEQELEKVKQEPVEEEEEQPIEEPEDEEKVTKEECEKRVSGMQASMQKHINDFKNQLESKEKELISVRAEVTSLNNRLDEATKELTSMASALVDKTNALDMLNSGVNTPNDELPTMQDGLRKCKTPSEKVAFLKAGRYVR